jgi:hypothetical protein
MDTPLRTEQSPDGELVLELFEADDYYLGFRGQAWHTHGDLLVPEYGATPREAALAFFDSVVAGSQPICVSRRVGRDVEMWITDDPETEHKYVEDGETLFIRDWSGRRVVA